jgi:hypothetical protein
MKKKFISALLTMLLSLNFLPAGVSAHILQTQGSLGAVLHIDPDDSPIAGKPSGIFFDFKDKSNHFKIENCDCNLVIMRNGQIIFNQPFEQPSGGRYTFPAQDVYVIKAVGSPKTGSSFEPFELSYTTRVERGIADDGTVSQPSAKKTLTTLAVSILVLFGIVVLVRYIIIKRNTNY